METYLLIILCMAAFFAGFIDAIVGGGGLIQSPIALIALPNVAVSQILGSLKIPGISGTSIAAWQYAKKVKINWKLILIMSIFACFFAFIGSQLLLIVNNKFMKPFLFCILVVLAIYTFYKKNFGQSNTIKISYKKQIITGILCSSLIGFYDGFIGPGTGSFLVFAFITLLGNNFLQASAHAKLINIASNIGSISLFIFKGKILWTIAIPMAVCNAFGGYIGAKTAIKKGNSFIRVFFLIVVVATFCKLGFDIFTA